MKQKQAKPKVKERTVIKMFYALKALYSTSEISNIPSDRLCMIEAKEALKEFSEQYFN